MFIKKSLLALSVAAALTACGGGGGGDVDVLPVSTTVTRAIPSINSSAAFFALLGTDNTWSNLKSNDSYLTTANLFERTDVESIPFVTPSGSSTSVLRKEFQLQLNDSAGRRGAQYIWALHFDADANPIGVAATQELFDWKSASCLTKSSSSILPISTNGSGIYLSGLTGAYDQEFRAGLFAGYCDLTAQNASANVEWSVADGDPNPYICVTFPSMGPNPKTRFCLSTDTSGRLTNAPWIRTYSSDGSPATDFKDDSVNKPYENLSGTVNQKNYWYGQVWRPSDGFIYQQYATTKFASELACKNQTQIDWKSTWPAVNITWTCVNVITQ